MPFQPGDYRNRVLPRLKENLDLADPATGDPFLVCGMELDVTPAEAEQGLDDVIAFWRKEQDKPAYRGVIAELRSHSDEYREILTTPVRLADAAIRVRAARRAASEAAERELDRLVSVLRRAQGTIHRSKVDVLRSFAVEEGMSPQAFTAWLSRQEVTEEPAAAQPWDGALRRQIREELDELARMDRAHAERYRTLLTFLAVGSLPSPAILSFVHKELVRRNLEVIQDAVTSRKEQLLSQVKTRLLPPGGLERYLASLRADAQDMLAKDLRRVAQLTGLLSAPEMSAMAARITAKDWGIDGDEALGLVRRAAAVAHLAVEVNTEVRLIVCAQCGRPQVDDGGERCVYCPAALRAGCVVCGELIPQAADICPRCGAPCGALRRAEETVGTLRHALESGFAAEAYGLVMAVIGVIDDPAAPAELAALATEARERYTEAGVKWKRLLADTRRGALWEAASTAQWLAENARDVPSPDLAAPESAASRIPTLEQQKREVTTAARRAAALSPEAREAELQRLLLSYPDSPDVRTALAKIPLRPPTGVEPAVSGEGIELAWRAAPGASADVVYRVERHVDWPPPLAGTTDLGTTTRKLFNDAGVAGGAMVRYTVTAVDGPRVSAPVDAGSALFFTRDLALLNATVVGRRAVQLEWPSEHLGAGEVTVEREIDRPGEKGTTKRFRPATAGRCFDETVETGVPYRYRAYLTYRDREGKAIRTPGRETTTTVYAEPEPIARLRAVTGDDGRTTVTYDDPAAGTVRIYAVAGDRAPFWSSRTRTELEVAAATARLVGEDPGQVVDAEGRGLVTYRAVTVSGPDVALGAKLVHVALPPPLNLRVVDDEGGRLRLGFELPPGVPAAVVRWSTLSYPAGEAGTGTSISREELAAAGGHYDIDAPEDNKAVYVSVLAAAPAPAGGEPVAARTGARLLARRAVPLVVRYSVDIIRILGPRVDISVSAQRGRLLPALTVVLREDLDPADIGDGVTVCSYAGGTTEAALQIERGKLFDGYLRLFASPEPGVVVELHGPSLNDRRIKLT
jgi:hypothetical protein